MKIGLMGGTFNPIHLAHLRIAEVAQEACGLDRVIFIPAGDPPHKPLAGDVSFALRCRMVETAIAGFPCFEISAIEGERPGKSYSIDTIEYFRIHNPDDILYFIIGGDSFREIGSWYRYEDILRSCNLVVVDRPGTPLDEPLSLLPVAMRKEFRYTADLLKLEHISGTTVSILSGTPLDISSTRIRELLASGSSICSLVPPLVEAFIKEQGIYRQCR